LFNKYYQQELQNLRELAVEFSKTHPIAASMLSGPIPDPDVERLLEGVAFLNGLLQQKLDDEFPELIHSLMNVIFPHYMRPIPCMSIVSFKAKTGANENIFVPAGTSLASTPVDGTPCTFQTCFETEVHPLNIVSLEAQARSTGEPERMKLVMELQGLTLDQWTPKGLSFLPGGTFSQSTDIFALLTRYLRQITIRPLDEEGSACVLPPECLVDTGFDPNNSLFPFPMRAFYSYTLLHEYFILPAKFLFLNLTGWERWRDRGKGSRFEISFEFLPSSIHFPPVTSDQIVLFCTPVINLFKMEGEPILLNHRTTKVRIRPAAKEPEHYHVYDVDEVVGFTRGSVQKTTYVPLELFGNLETGDPVYQMIRHRSPVDESLEAFLAFPYQKAGDEPKAQTLSISLTCTNGALPERLQFGDVCVQTSDSPELLTFKNLVPPSFYVEPPYGRNMLWKFLSHLSLNYLSVASAENLKEILTLYALQEGRDRTRASANLREIEGISNLAVSPVRRLVKGNMIHGQRIEIAADKAHYASTGNLLLFASVLDHFFSAYSAMQTFTRMELKENSTGEIFTWPERMGTRCLL
jgi:type VI secretion system protein ImpG